MTKTGLNVAFLHAFRNQGLQDSCETFKTRMQEMIHQGLLSQVTNPGAREHLNATQGHMPNRNPKTLLQCNSNDCYTTCGESSLAS